CSRPLCDVRSGDAVRSRDDVTGRPTGSVTIHRTGRPLHVPLPCQHCGRSVCASSQPLLTHASLHLRSYGKDRPRTPERPRLTCPMDGATGTDLPLSNFTINICPACGARKVRASDRCDICASPPAAEPLPERPTLDQQQ